MQAVKEELEGGDSLAAVAQAGAAGDEARGKEVRACGPAIEHGRRVVGSTRPPGRCDELLIGIEWILLACSRITL